jgi:hypothetical protein
MSNLSLKLFPFVLAPLTLCSIGCARYEYDLVHPPELAQHIGRDKPVEVTLEPLNYRYRTVESRLVMQVCNSTNAPIRLLGDQSTVVDPRRQSRPLRGRAIAPGSFIKLVFPPLMPVVEPRGPVIGFGVMAIGSSGGYYRRRFLHGGAFGYDPAFDGPRYYSVYAADDGTYWEWDGEGEIRVILVYQQGDQKPFTHEFVFRRKRV